MKRYGAEEHARVLALDGAVVSRGAFTLGPVDVAFGSGVTALLGANGAGKTTLIQLVVGLLPARQGSVRQHGGAAGAPMSVGYLPQDFTAPRHVRVFDYLRFIAWAKSTRDHAIEVRAISEALEAVGLASVGRQRVGTLSGGMLRRLGVAQALLGSPPAIVLDEPTVGLDPVQRIDLRDLLRELGERVTVVLSTHLAEDVASVADGVVVLREGQAVFAGTVDELVLLDGTSERTGAAVERGFLAAVRGSA
ncbi:ATP-binding cassette domain-containing protein [Cellulomonas gilvus]|uniref:ABC transporter related protein n=1 Tax=Cellulomonas gilvus (strain ATCC 13127 / NRRL B-14078) TaxID=593907 RepID=F8A6Q1_CELGA|nr:ATP-binding cassette domain-containing protein [Cellulomonas gilvus]AEI11111.1 ABC transporter related protein [Cellulomonas gilvus ATCC 13127]